MFRYLQIGFEQWKNTTFSLSVEFSAKRERPSAEHHTSRLSERQFVDYTHSPNREEFLLLFAQRETVKGI
ncbi:hypothetical protein TNCV_4128331, partial [Trichonephila clavipes]